MHGDASAGSPGTTRARTRPWATRALLAATLHAIAWAAAGCGSPEPRDPAPPGTLGQLAELPEGTELVALYFGATTCRPCLRPEVKEAVREMQRRLEERAGATGRDFSSVGVALDWSIPAGVEFLAETAPFDEIAVGRYWANAAAIEHLWGDPQTVPAIPQVIVLERDVRHEDGGRLSFARPRVLRRVLGASTILGWVEEGAPLDDAP